MSVEVLLVLVMWFSKCGLLLWSSLLIGVVLLVVCRSMGDGVDRA